jgi:hypothetical protein
MHDAKREADLFGVGCTVETDDARFRTSRHHAPGLAQIQWQSRLISLSQMQIGCLPGSQMGFTSMQREPVGTGAGVEPSPLPTNPAAAATMSPVRIVLRIPTPLEETDRTLAPPRSLVVRPITRRIGRPHPAG